MFAIGLFPAIASFFLRRYLEEPLLFIQKAKSKSNEVPIRFLVKDAATTKVTVAMFILCSVQNFGYYGIMTWLPSYLSNSFGYSLTRSSLWTAVTVLGMSLGIWLFGHLADAFGRRPTFIAYQLGAAGSVFVYSHLRNPIALLIGGAVMGVFVNGMIGGYGALMSELYPTEARATAQNTLFNLGRAVGGFGPYVVGSLTALYSFKLTTAVLSLIYFIDLLATILLLPETRNVALD
jgi:MFS family permease